MGEVAKIISSVTGCSRRSAEMAEDRLKKSGLLLEEVEEERKSKTFSMDVTEVTRASDKTE